MIIIRVKLFVQFSVPTARDAPRRLNAVTWESTKRPARAGVACGAQENMDPLNHGVLFEHLMREQLAQSW